MSGENWVFPNLEAIPGAWRRYWVHRIAFPNFYWDMLHGTPLSGYTLRNLNVPLKHQFFDPLSRRAARRSRQALKALQNGAEIRDLPGAGTAIADMKLRLEELAAQTRAGIFAGSLPFLTEHLSTACGTYTYLPDLEARLADHLLGSSGRRLADTIAQQWLAMPALKFLDQSFHPLAQHFRVDCREKTTPEEWESQVQRTPGKIPIFNGVSPYFDASSLPTEVTYVGPTPPVADYTAQDADEEIPVRQLSCTLELFDLDWDSSPEAQTGAPKRFENPPTVPFSRAYQVDSLDSWVDLVARYPLELVDAGTKSEFQRLTACEGVILSIDWGRLRKDFDVVHFTLGAVLECADVALAIPAEKLSAHFAVLPGVRYSAFLHRCVPGSTVWLHL